MEFSNSFISRSQTVSVFGAGGFFTGFVAGGSSAIVNNKNVFIYSMRTGMNCAVIGCCIGGINEGLAVIRGTRDPMNPAIACGLSGFLASIQRASPKRAGFAGLICAGVGIVGHYGWVELTKRFYDMRNQRREELGLEPDGMNSLIEPEKNSNSVNNDTFGWLQWGPVRPITDAEIEERRRIDRLRK
jgi:hypothetical protein